MDKLGIRLAILSYYNGAGVRTTTVTCRVPWRKAGR